MEQRENTKFCFKLNKTRTLIYEMLHTVYGDEALSRSNVSEWFKWRKVGREDLQDGQRSRRPSTSRNLEATANVRKMVTRVREWALTMMSDELNISKETIRQILHEDFRKRVCVKFVPQRLTDEQKQGRLTSCQDFIQICQDNSSFLDCIFLFPKVNTALKGKRFQDVED
jgi:hypothetical protein